MPRARKKSDDVYNARRRLRRAAARARKQGNIAQVQRIEALIPSTYAGGSRATAQDVQRSAQAAVAALKQIQPQQTKPKTRKTTKAQRQAAATIRNLRRIASGPRGFSRPTLGKTFRNLASAYIDRDNALFERQINLASQGKPSTLDDVTKRGIPGETQAHIFWQSTRSLWIGTDPSARYQVIIDELGVDSLRAAFEKVMQVNQDAIEQARQAISDVQDTSRDMRDESADVPIEDPYLSYNLYVNDIIVALGI